MWYIDEVNNNIIINTTQTRIWVWTYGTHDVRTIHFSLVLQSVEHFSNLLGGEVGAGRRSCWGIEDERNTTHRIPFTAADELASRLIEIKIKSIVPGHSSLARVAFHPPTWGLGFISATASTENTCTQTTRKGIFNLYWLRGSTHPHINRPELWLRSVWRNRWTRNEVCVSLREYSSRDTGTKRSGTLQPIGCVGAIYLCVFRAKWLTAAGPERRRGILSWRGVAGHGQRVRAVKVKRP